MQKLSSVPDIFQANNSPSTMIAKAFFQKKVFYRRNEPHVWLCWFWCYHHCYCYGNNAHTFHYNFSSLINFQKKTWHPLALRCMYLGIHKYEYQLTTFLIWKVLKDYPLNSKWLIEILNPTCISENKQTNNSYSFLTLGCTCDLHDSIPSSILRTCHYFWKFILMDVIRIETLFLPIFLT